MDVDPLDECLKTFRHQILSYDIYCLEIQKFLGLNILAKYFIAWRSYDDTPFWHIHNKVPLVLDREGGLNAFAAFVPERL